MKISPLFERIANPRDLLDYNAAICDRASLLTKRLHPLPAPVHGFADPVGFIENCQRRAARNQFYRDTFKRLVAKEEARGRSFVAVMARRTIAQSHRALMAARAARGEIA